MNLPIVAAAAAAGFTTGPWLRAITFSHSVAYGRPRRAQCPRCRQPAGTGWPRRLPVTGRCPHCGRRLGAPPLAVEATTALVLAAIAWTTPTLNLMAAMTALALTAVVLSFIDIAVHRLPSRLTAATAAVAGVVMLAVAVVSRDWSRPATALIAAAVFGGSYLTVALFLSGIGLGDVAWATVLALTLGWFSLRTATTAMAAAIAAAAVTAAGLLVTRRVYRRSALAFGPFLSAGALIAFTTRDL